MPHYFTVQDDPWLRALLEEFSHFRGRKRTELLARLREPLPARAPKAKLQIALHVLDALARGRGAARVPPQAARAAVFRAAAATQQTRDAVLASVASAFEVTVAQLESSLFADLRGERLVRELPKDMSPSRLATDANVAIVAALIRRAARLQITAFGNTRPLVRHARLMGLICTLSSAQARATAGAASNISPEAAAPGVVLELSGPFSLFRRTEVYGRALASLVPRLAWCTDYELRAACALGVGSDLSTLVVRSGDPIAPGRELPRYDRAVEDRFERDFRRAAPEWDVIREPRPLASGDQLIFPDFELVDRRDPSRRWLLEIVGFWTRRYLTQKLERLRQAGIERLVLCIDQRRDCAEADLPNDARLIRYKTRIDPRAVLAIVAG